MPSFSLGEDEDEEDEGEGEEEEGGEEGEATR
jgi:hypothetical protein